jgi:hypothetical protein
MEVEGDNVHQATALQAAAAELSALFVWLISHRPAVLFSQNKPAIM